MKYIRGYILAIAFALMTWGLTEFAKAHSVLVDMVYPYASRLIQDTLAGWSGDAAFCLWQVVVVLLIVVLLASIIAMILLKWNFFQWMGWVLSGVCLIWCMHTGIYGLNQYSSSLSEDIKLSTTVPGDSLTPLIDAATYFRDQANILSEQVERDENGQLVITSFADVAEQAASGFKNLVYEKNYAVFGGVTTPVKELGWADMYTAMGISGVTMPLTGEAAVNPNIPAASLPFTISHEMCHRMCIAPERDANLGAFLACTNSDDVLYQYSGYFMAFRYCYSSLASISTATASNAVKKLYAGMTEEMQLDMQAYSDYCNQNIKQDASNFASTVNNAYIQASGDSSGIRSYGEVTDLLLNWYWQEVYLPEHADDIVEDEDAFDPFDKDYIFGGG